MKDRKASLNESIVLKKSICSLSIFVTTAMVGESLRNEPSLSSASATRKSPCPNLALLPVALSFPPITTVGSRPLLAITVAINEVVVVFPCAPATSIPYFILASSASISALGITGIDFLFASTTSALSLETAEDITTTWASSTFSALCPIYTFMPRLFSLFVVSDSLTSEPVTS